MRCWRRRVGCRADGHMNGAQFNPEQALKWPMVRVQSFRRMIRSLATNTMAVLPSNPPESGGPRPVQPTPDLAREQLSIKIDPRQSSGPAADTFESSMHPSVVLGLSPTSSTTNRERLRTILGWLLQRAEHITVLDGWWFQRWDLLVFEEKTLAQATDCVLRKMRRLHRRVNELSAELRATGRITVVPWPDTRDLQNATEIRCTLERAANRSTELQAAIESTAMDYVHARGEGNLSVLGKHAALTNYVIEEVSTLVHLALRVSPIEVYPGPDLPLMRQLALGKFCHVFPYDLSNRSHISLVFDQPLRLRAGTPGDWPEIERLLRAWPRHFVEEGIRLARDDFEHHRTIVCIDNRRLCGFLIWRTDGQELELLWMAVEPSRVQQGIGRRMVEGVLGQRSTEARVFGRTATTDSIIPNSEFSGAAYARTLGFFQKLGFTIGKRYEQYWGPQNHMIEVEKSYGHGGEDIY
jgi:tRNA-dependent cyclodipeptide synthase